MYYLGKDFFWKYTYKQKIFETDTTIKCMWDMNTRYNCEAFERYIYTLERMIDDMTTKVTTACHDLGIFQSIYRYDLPIVVSQLKFWLERIPNKKELKEIVDYFMKYKDLKDSTDKYRQVVHRFYKQVRMLFLKLKDDWCWTEGSSYKDPLLEDDYVFFGEVWKENNM